MMNRHSPTHKKKYSSFFCLLFFFLLLSGCQDRNTDSEKVEAQLDSLSQELALYKRTTDSLQALIEKGEIATSYSIYFGREFDTITNPEAFIANSLVMQPELIPLEPVLGGQMEFREVKVLTPDWVLAMYDDGHVEGKSIYEYELTPDGDLRFTELISSHTQE